MCAPCWVTVVTLIRLLLLNIGGVIIIAGAIIVVGKKLFDVKYKVWLSGIGELLVVRWSGVIHLVLTHDVGLTLIHHRHYAQLILFLFVGLGFEFDLPLILIVLLIVLTLNPSSLLIIII